MFKSSIKAWNYAQTAFITEKPKYKRKQQYKSFALSLLNHKTCTHWFDTLEENRYKEILSHRPRLFLKPFKAYLSTQYCFKKKMKIICDTYDFIYANDIKKIIYNESNIICKFVLKNNLPGKLKIGYDDRYRKEGELVLSLEIDHLHGTIASVAFSFERNENNEWMCKIGCLQGRPISHGIYVTKEAQKLMNGIRPKAFLIEILQEFCKVFDIKEIHAISGKHQAQNRKHLIHIPFLHTIRFSYDDFWTEIGGEDMGKNWYSLPLNTNRKNICEIKSEKRASYKKRYELIDSVKISLSNYLKNTPINNN